MNLRLICLLPVACLLIALPSTAQKRLEPVPDRLLSFQHSVQNGKPVLSWSLTNNEAYAYFEVEKSTDGKDFTTAGLVFTTDKAGTERYVFKGMPATGGTLYFRLKLCGKAHYATYSKIIVVRPKTESPDNKAVLFLQNPVQANLVFQYNAPADADYDVTVHNTAGVKFYSTKISCTKGLNTVHINAGRSLTRGTYVLEIVGTGSCRTDTGLFIKY